jgi:hypothetical protein
MPYEEWISEHGSEIYREWQLIHDEYGDLAPLLADFKMQRYNEANAEHHSQSKEG